ncbi:MAG: hypothetical protein DLM68_14370 [Hyphomicrobiales bacterium]|nr:MAG: hypothetical protein DLM68_14370 [Hyphomicrobiales bacterium]
MGGFFLQYGACCNWRCRLRRDRFGGRFFALSSRPPGNPLGQCRENRRWRRRGSGSSSWGLFRVGNQGQVHRCHGDFHLRNIVLIEDRPVLFDAIEFDAALAARGVL